MSLKIAAEKDFSEGLKSKIRSQCTGALQLLGNNPEGDPHEVVHEVRKSFKKIRGALRLVRDQIDFYKEENVFFRDEARRISDVRDATSVIETLDDLYEQYENQLYKNTFNQFRNHLNSRREKLTEEYVKDGDVLKIIENQLSDKCEKIDQWPIEIKSFKTLSPSVERVYKRGRKGYKRAKRSRSTKHFHEWRKRVKYLRYQLDLLHRIWPEFLDSWEDELHDLSDYLGDDHDLYLLSEEVEKNKDQFSDPESYQLLDSLIKSGRSDLQTNALNLGKRLYHLDHENFAALLEASWEAFDTANDDNR